MPKRTNRFQQLIRSLEEQLDSEATVEESVMLPDRDGNAREVDVLVRMTSNANEVLIAVECRDHQRKADVLWIEQLRTKYDEIPSVDVVLAVAGAGFSKKALQKAAKLKIRTAMLGEAMQTGWNTVLRRIESVHIQLKQYTFRSVTFSAYPGTDPVPPEVFKPEDAWLRFGDKDAIPVQQAMRASALHPSIQAIIDKVLAEGGDEAISMLDMKGWTLIVGEIECPLHSAQVTFSRPVLTGDLPLKHATYRGASVAFGDGDVGGLNFSVVSSMREAGDGSIPFRIDVRPMH